jgi:hypothetical protein
MHEQQLDEELAALTAPGTGGTPAAVDDTAFRARVLARIEAERRGRRAAWPAAWPGVAWRPVVVAVLLVAAGVASWVGRPWRLHEPAQHAAEHAGAAPPDGAATADEALPPARVAHVRGGVASQTADGARRSRGRRAVAAGGALDVPPPYRVDDPVRIERVALAPVRVPAVRDDPALAPLAPPPSGVVDPVDVDVERPRR